MEYGVLGDEMVRSVHVAPYSDCVNAGAVLVQHLCNISTD